MAKGSVKPPAYQWFPKDAESDEAYKFMTYEQQGIYRALLDHEWIEGSLPLDPSRIARLLPKITVARFLKLWIGIVPCFVEQSGRLVNPRLEAQRDALAAYKVEQKLHGQQGARRRWGRHSDPIRVANRVAIDSPMANDSSASASAVLPPVVPLEGGRITRAERREAERIRGLHFGCQHQPRCATVAACVELIVCDLRSHAS